MSKRILAVMGLLPLLAMAQTASQAPAHFDLAINNANAGAVYMQIGSGTPYNILVSPEVTGQVSITLRDTTVLEALDSLRELYGYDYKIVGNRIFVLPNGVQTRMFKVNYLPGRRRGISDVHVTSSAITVANTGQNGQSGQPVTQQQQQSPIQQTQGSGPIGASNNGAELGARPDDSSHVHTSTDEDFWEEVKTALTTLVGHADSRSVIVNAAAGVIIVRATPAELHQVEAYLKAVQLSVERQVMLEAKIVQVTLNKDSQAGINWGAFTNALLGSHTKAAIGIGAPGVTVGTTGALSDGVGNTVTAGASIGTGALGQGFYGLALQSPNFASLMNFLQTQGNSTVLSSPRIATLNNQKAVLKVGSDSLFVTGVQTTTSNTGSSQTSSPSLTLTPFFSGIALDVTPQIDEDGNVIMHIHPSVSVVTAQQVNINLGTLGQFQLPLASSAVNESDSIVRIKDGQIVAIGGLMQQTVSDNRNGVPLISDIPVIGGLFRQTANNNDKSELVILIKPTIIDDANWPDSQGSAATAAAAPAQATPVK